VVSLVPEDPGSAAEEIHAAPAVMVAKCRGTHQPVEEGVTSASWNY
jgi:hypothetical protein